MRPGYYFDEENWLLRIVYPGGRVEWRNALSDLWECENSVSQIGGWEYFVYMGSL